MKGRFFVYVPRLDPRSNGVSLLYEFALQLKLYGAAVHLVCHEGVEKQKPGYHRAFVRYARLPFTDWSQPTQRFPILPEDIAVYSETVVGNPLSATRVVRYLMNLPGVLTGEKGTYGPTNFLVAYSRAVDPELFPVFILKPEVTATRPVKKRNQVVLHFGKVHRETLEERFHRLEPVLAGYERTRVVTRNYPRSKSKLRRLLAESKLLISFDPLSNLQYESTLLGTPVHVVDDTIHRINPEFNIALHGFRFGNEEPAPFDFPQILDVYQRQIQHGNRESIERFLTEVAEHFELVMADPEFQRRNNQRILDFLEAARRRQTLSAAYVLRNIDEPRHLPAALFRRFFPLRAAIANLVRRMRGLAKTLLFRRAS